MKTFRLELTHARPFPLIHFPSPWTSQDLARRTGVSLAMVSAWRQGTAAPTRERLGAILEALAPGLDISERHLVYHLYGYLPPGDKLLAWEFPGMALSGLGQQLAGPVSASREAPTWLITKHGSPSDPDTSSHFGTGGHLADRTPAAFRGGL